MTCIIGYEHNNKVYIGGDSAGVSHLDYRIREDSKVFKKGKMIFGFTSSFRMGQILRYAFKIPKQKQKDDLAYLCTTFIDSLIKCFLAKGYAKERNNVVSGGTFLLGYNNRLYMVQDDFQIEKVKVPYSACGCGESYALGAMYILHLMQDMSPEEKIQKALETAEAFSTGVRRPFKIVKV